MGCYLFWFAFHPPSPRHQDDLTAEVRVHLFSLRLELTIVTEYRANRRRETGSGPLAAELMSGFLSFAASFLWLNATLFPWLSLRLFCLRSRLDRCWFRRTPCFLRLRRPLRFS